MTFALACLMTAPATAQVPDDVVTAEVIPGWREDGTHIAGLKLTLKPGWKTYWRSPGDAGIPPRFDWGGSGNLAGARVSYPVPEVQDQAGMRTIGYSGDVVFPLHLRPADAAGPIRLSGSVDLGICSDICVPVRLPVSAILPPGGGPSRALVRALDDRPMTAGEAGVASVDCTFEPLSDGMRITARLDMPRIGRDEVAVVELSDPTIWVAETDTRRDGGTLTLVTEAVPPEAGPMFLGRGDVRITLLGGGQAVDITGCG